MKSARLEAGETTVRFRPQSLKPLSRIQGYSLAVVSVSVALGAALLLERLHFSDLEVPVFLFAVALAAWYAGGGAAVLTLLLSCLSLDYFFIKPIYSLDIAGDLPFLIIFALLASLVTWFGT